MEYPPAITQIKIFHRLFTQWLIMNGNDKVIVMILALKKPILSRFGGFFGTLRFDQIPFPNTLLGFTPLYDFKTTNANHAGSPGVYTRVNVMYLSRKEKIQLNCELLTLV